MRTSMIIAPAALVAGAAAWGNGTEPVYTTEVVTAYTTFCPAATQITHGGVTYTVTSVRKAHTLRERHSWLMQNPQATTLTITNCPCTVTKPVISTPVVPPTSVASPVVPTTPVVSVPTVAPVPTTSPVVIPSSSVVVPVIPSGSPVVPIPITTGTSGPAPVTTPIYANTTVPITSATVPGAVPGTAAPSGTGASTPGSSPVIPFKGAAPKMAASGASLAGLLGLAAFFL
ncbi:MAG: hypothetical protein Q9220_004649 [cf. Caloplaca sp. 1 TL-2023]